MQAVADRLLGVNFGSLKDQHDNAKKDRHLLTDVEELFKSLAKV